MSPEQPHYDLAEFRTLPYHDRVRLACVDWVHCGFGAPTSAYLFYLLKIGLWIGGWILVVRASAMSGGVADWWTTPMAFVKAIAWTMLWEGMGFGCGSGPLTGRYWPPVAGLGHWLRPGTITLPAFPERLPFTAGSRRTVVDVALYAGYLGTGAALLFADRVGPATVLPILVLLALASLRDKTVFLASRGEHYATTLAVVVFVGSAGIQADTTWAQVPVGVIAGAKAVQVAIWWWAATSKLNHHFPYVVGVMLTNHPLNRFPTLRRRLVRAYPHDLRPGTVPRVLAHGGTVIEYVVPLVLVLSDGGVGTIVGLGIMVAFHAWIFSSFALGVPQEWNVLFVYSALVLFGTNAQVKPWQLGSPLLWAVLLLALVVVPVVGNLRPDKVSFLPSMRYYAGNWATTTWLFTPDALARFDREVPKVADELLTQLRRFYDDDANEVSLSRVPAFRAMHLHGRLVQRLICRAVEDPDDHVIREGELVAGMALGWNFGDGHLHDEQLLDAVQERCGFAPGELRIVVIESQPITRATWSWRIVDAADGVLLRGTAPVTDALEQQPWPDPIQGRDVAP